MFRKINPRIFAFAAFASLVFLQCSLPARPADNLRLRDGISFLQDTDSGFPIIADNADDATIGTDKPTLLFFGASGDLNTNRQAKRLVDLYKKFNGKLKVILIDVDHPANADAAKLIRSHYKGYIPLEVILSSSGRILFTHVGELDSGPLKAQIEKALQ